MPVTALHAEIAGIALAAVSRFGFALGGGNALIMHGVTDRFTQDVDLVTDWDDGVERAAEAVVKALARAGFHTEPVDKTGGLADIFPGMGKGLAEWIVTAPSEERALLQLAYFGRNRELVRMGVGPVLGLEDALGWKVVALASRVSPRDYIDVAEALGRYTVEHLIRLAVELDPGLGARDFAEAGQRLDEFTEADFAAYELGPEDVALVRKRFRDWPR